MTYDELRDWPLNETRVSCADGTFGMLTGVDAAEGGMATVRVSGEPRPRYIKASELEPTDFDTLVQLRGAA